MRRFLYLLTFVLIVCLVQTAEARKLALLVGVDDYEDIQSLKCCVNDMNTLKEALMKIGFKEENIHILVTGGHYSFIPTKKKIEKKLSEILSMAQPTDIVFIAFSGHGAQNGNDVYFCPPDTDLNDLDGTSVSITKTMADLAKCKAKFKWMVVDACRDDPTSTRAAKSLRVIPAPPSGIALLQSCSKGELSYEEKRAGGNGYFTKNFAAALSGEADANHDGRLTLFEVCDWTAEHTKSDVEQTENATQRPFFSGSIPNYILTEDLNVPKAKALVEEARKAVEEEEYELAVQKYDEAIALSPKNESWKHERKMAQKLLKRPGSAGGNPAPQQPASATSPVQTPTETHRAGERQVKTVNGVEFAFRWCPPGTFMMGSPTNEEGRYVDEEKQHQVTLTKGFWMMETEVTQKQWKAVMGNNPSYYKGDDLPVERVSWNDCQEFCKKCKSLGMPVQLPTEAQWEYACRAGTTGAYAGSLVDMAWYTSNSGDETHPVGTKKPNAWGLYDMHGNVWEWCADYWKEEYPSGSVTDPTAPSDGSRRVNRGGGWASFARSCRSARRLRDSPESRDYTLGFRCVRGQ